VKWIHSYKYQHFANILVKFILVEIAVTLPEVIDTKCSNKEYKSYYRLQLGARLLAMPST